MFAKKKPTLINIHRKADFPEADNTDFEGQAIILQVWFLIMIRLAKIGLEGPSQLEAEGDGRRRLAHVESGTGLHQGRRVYRLRYLSINLSAAIDHSIMSLLPSSTPSLLHLLSSTLPSLMTASRCL
jgi:hypothetical protein